MFAVWIWICNWRSREMKKARKSKKTTNIFVMWWWTNWQISILSVTCLLSQWHRCHAWHVTSHYLLCHRLSSLTFYTEKTRHGNITPGHGLGTTVHCISRGLLRIKSLWPCLVTREVYGPRAISIKKSLSGSDWAFASYWTLQERESERDDLRCEMRPCLSWLGSCILL